MIFLKKKVTKSGLHRFFCTLIFQSFISVPTYFSFVILQHQEILKRMGIPLPPNYLPLSGGGKENEKNRNFQSFKLYYFFHLKSEKQKLSGLVTPGLITLAIPFIHQHLTLAPGCYLHKYHGCVSWLCLSLEKISLRKLIKLDLGFSHKNSVEPAAGRDTATTIAEKGITDG